MCVLLENPELADKLRRNGREYMEELDSNQLRVRTYIDIYHALLKNFHEKVQIPQVLLS